MAEFRVMITRAYTIAAESAHDAKRMCEEYPALWDSIVVDSEVTELTESSAPQHTALHEGKQ